MFFRGPRGPSTCLLYFNAVYFQAKRVDMEKQYSALPAPVKTAADKMAAIWKDSSIDIAAKKTKKEAALAPLSASEKALFEKAICLC
jgi:hypothetical protein